MKNIVLCGFMGCGKSTVGKLLADATGFAFVDMDSYIEQTDGRTVSAIFTADGEAHFRHLEHEACRALSGQTGLVIATGGGAVLRADNVDALRDGGTIVWLKVHADTVLSRLQDDTTRPLLQRPDKAAAVTELLTARTPLYEAAADITVDADADAPTVAAAILAALGNA